MIIIGERINATRRPIREAIQSHDEEWIATEVRTQDEAGSHYIDLNAGTGSGDPEQEVADLSWLIEIALRTTEKHLSLDSSDPSVLERAMAYLDGRRPALVNSVNGEAERLEPLLALAARRECPIIALAMDDTGIPSEAAGRVAVCESIMTAARRAGVPQDRLLFDPLVLPMSSDISQAQVTFATLRELKRRFPQAKTTLGLSNVSYGLPDRARVNHAFLLAALVSGLDSAICDPTRDGILEAITLGELLAGKDKHCRRYARRIRKGEIR
jgi:5-methyltetrahydrofolate corrinoid/iron sulfur protein methyltransferase